jgi:hypothetical protein
MPTDYTDAKSLALLAARIQAFSDERKIYFAAFVMDRGLMKPTGFKAWLVWKLITRASAMKEMSRPHFYAVLCGRSPDATRMALDTVDQTCAWLTDGKDLTCPRSAGGFNADEVWLLEAIAKAVSETV